MDLQKLQEACKAIEKNSGKGSIFVTGKNKSVLLPRWSSGIADFDNLVGGGIPKGRIVEIYGPESSGKTSLAYWLMSRHEKGLYIPIEGTYDEERAASMGVKSNQMIVYRANYGEEALNAVVKFAKAGIPIITIDSVPACQPREDMDKMEKDAQSETRIGGVARLFSKMLPTIVRICEETGTTLVLINQVRDKMGAMAFQEKEDTPGGRAIKFYSSIRIKTARRAWIEVPNRNPAISSEREKVGIIMKVKLTKSKVSNPFGEAELPFFFDRAFVGYDNIKEVRAEIMKERKEKYKT